MDLLKFSVPVPTIFSIIKNTPTNINKWRDERAIERIRKGVFFEKNACWYYEPDGTKSGPYCSGCWEHWRKQIHLIEKGSRGYYYCLTCKVPVQVEKYPEEVCEYEPIVEYLNKW